MDYQVGHRLCLYLQHKQIERKIKSPPPKEVETMVVGVVTAVIESEGSYHLDINGKPHRLATGLLTCYGPPAEQWYVHGVVRQA